jgi:hypothetical protein
MANLTGYSQSFGAPIFSSSTTPVTVPGDKGRTVDGREFVYCQAGAAGALVVGNVIQTAAELTNHDNLTPAAAAVGALTVTVTLGNTAATENQYAGGLLVIDTTPGLGYSYLIESHPAANASATCEFTIAAPGVQVALTTDSRVTLTPNPWKGVIQAPATTLTGAIVGVCTYPIGASEYGWLQVKGPCGVLAAGTIAVGAVAISPSGTAGAVVTDPANASVVIIGSAMVATASGEVNQILLNIQ